MSLSNHFDNRGSKSFRAFFAERWSQFLRENYRSPEAVAAAFGVRYQTALYWWNADHAPNGSSVAIAFGMHPEAAHRSLSPMITKEV